MGKAKFFLEVGKHKRRSAINGTKANVKILAALGRIAFGSLFWIALALMILMLIENNLRSHMDFLRPLSTSERNYNIEQLRLYAQLLTAIFSIYFATMGIILSSGYIKLRGDIIQLLINEQVGSIFARILVFSATFNVTASSLPLFGVDPGYFVYVAATIMTLSSSLTLFPLGQRLFNFSDGGLKLQAQHYY